MSHAAGGESKTTHPVLIGSAGAIGAVTLLSLGDQNPAFFQLGTVALTLSLVPLSIGLNRRCGAMLGLLFGVVWAATRHVMVEDTGGWVLLSPISLLAMGSLTALGSLAGSVLESGREPVSPDGTAGDRPGLAPRASRASGRERPEILSAVQAILAGNRDWLLQWDQQGDPWTSFDNHVRQWIHAATGARRVRCFRLNEHGRPAPMNRSAADPAASLTNEALVAHVLAHNRRYVADGPGSGPLLRELAERSGGSPVWIVPIRDREGPIGVMTADELPAGADHDRLELVADLLEALWLHVHHANQLRTAWLLDRASGVLNRGEFLGLLEETVAAGYELREPVVVMAVSIEGLRGLDDTGQWQVRDEVVCAVGQAIRNGLRKDDAVGRFSDAQFVAVLRRLDTGLAELIAQKIVGAIQDIIARLDARTPLQLRAGLAGTGFEKVEPEELLRQAMAAQQRARLEDVPIRIAPARGRGEAVEVTRR